MSQYAQAPVFRTISYQVPWFGRGALALLAGVALLLVGFATVIRQKSPDLFASYDDLLNGAVQQAALARGFTCRNTYAKDQAAPILSRCDKQEVDELFSSITLWIADGVAREIRFRLRDKVLRFGDFFLLWGPPTYMLTCESVVAIWPTHYVLGDVESPPRGRNHITLPVRSVGLTPGPSHRYGGMTANAALNNCRDY